MVFFLPLVDYNLTETDLFFFSGMFKKHYFCMLYYVLNKGARGGGGVNSLGWGGKWGELNLFPAFIFVFSKVALFIWGVRGRGKSFIY